MSEQNGSVDGSGQTLLLDGPSQVPTDAPNFGLEPCYFTMGQGGCCCTVPGFAEAPNGAELLADPQGRLAPAPQLAATPQPPPPPAADTTPGDLDLTLVPTPGRLPWQNGSARGAAPAADPSGATLGMESRPACFAPGPGPAASDPSSISGYEILGELGRGGMGVVYKARQKALNRLVALKMILAGSQARPGEMARFRAEAEVVGRLQHPNIVQIHEVGEQGGRPYLSLELVSGSTLQAKIAGTPQPDRAAAHLVEILARAVHFAHQCGVVHRDLKPANVLLAVAGPDTGSAPGADAAQVTVLYGHPKITDFGLAKRLEEQSDQTRTGELLGTPSYMAPEQAAGRSGTAGPATDVYALGAILYEMLTGRPPFKALTPLDTLWQVLNEDPIPPGRLRPKLPKDLERICLKCLEKDPRRRYASARDLAEDLRRFLAGESVLARPATPVERLWRWSRRNPVPASLLLAITLGAVFGMWHLSELSKTLVRMSALDGAAQQSETMDHLNRYYSGVASHLKAGGIKGVQFWQKDTKTMPAPATMTIELGEQISARSETGMAVRLYSDLPFRSRKDGGVRDEFEREALEALRANPKVPFYRFEDYQGRPSLRYATARVMTEQGCVDCHNTHPDSPRSGWKVGDVRGVLEVVRPLHLDEDRVGRGLRGTVFLVAGVAIGLLLLSGLTLVAGRRRRVAPSVETGQSD